MRARRIEPALPDRRGVAAGERDHADRPGRAARAGGRQPPAADRRDRADGRRAGGAVDGGAAAITSQQRGGVPRGDAPAPSLPRPAPREAPPQHRAAEPDYRVDPPPDDRGWLHRAPDADPDLQLAGGGAGLPGAEPRAPGQVLRAAASAAAVQAAADDRRVRSLFPDRAVLPRRGRTRRSLARRVLSARLRDVVRHAGGRLRRDRAGAPRGVRGIRRRCHGDAGPISAHPVRRGDDRLRLRQARPAQSDPHRRRDRRLPRVGVRGLRDGGRRRRGGAGGAGARGGAAAAQLLRQARSVGP